MLTVNYKTTSERDRETLKLNNGKGVDVVLENGGTLSLLRSMRAVKKGGIISQVGYLGQQDTGHVDGFLSLLIDRTVNLRGINAGSRQDFEQMNKVIDSSKTRFDNVIDRVFPFDQTPEGLDYLWSGKNVGKIVVDVSDWSR